VAAAACEDLVPSGVVELVLNIKVAITKMDGASGAILSAASNLVVLGEGNIIVVLKGLRGRGGGLDFCGGLERETNNIRNKFPKMNTSKWKYQVQYGKSARQFRCSRDGSLLLRDLLLRG